jgi:hypothetical protein
MNKGILIVLRLSCSTAAIVLAWASVLHAQVQPALPAPPPDPALPATSPPPAEAFPVQPAPAPEAALLAPPPELAPPPAPEPAKEEAKPSLADKLGFGKNGGFFQPGALVQLWAGGSHVERAPTASYGFRLRRIEFVAKGEILPKQLSYRIVADFAKLPGVTTGTSNVAVTAPDGAPSPGTVAVPTTTIGADRSVLQDAFITYISEYADVGIGQFKMPVSLEALQSNQSTLLPERSRVTREYADTRDVASA